MGALKSKLFPKKVKVDKTRKKQIENINIDDVNDNNEIKYENSNNILNDKLLIRMRDQLQNDSKMFIINNLLLSVQFFENFDREIDELRKKNVNSFEGMLNARLNEMHKHSIMPDTILELVNKTVQINSKKTKGFSEVLHPQRCFIVYDNIEVLNDPSQMVYSSLIDGPIYKCILENSEFQGYVKLNLTDIEEQNLPRKITKTPETIPLSKISKSTSKLSNDKPISKKEIPTEKIVNKQIKKLKNDVGKPKLMKQISLPANLESDFSDFDSSEYGYTTIENHYTPKPIETVHNKFSFEDSIDNLVKLDPDCITTLENEEIKIAKELNVDLKKIRSKKQNSKKYLNSNVFASNFGDLFALKLGSILGFSESQVSSAMMQGAKIYLDLKLNRTFKNYEILPCAQIQSWPDLCVNWKSRARPTIADTKSKILYKWPTKRIIDTVLSFPCLILPIGFTPKRSEILNVEQSIQWRLNFANVERFLMSSLKHTQVRCFLFSLVLFKYYIEPRETKLGLNFSHLRAHLFWQCEKDFLNWEEMEIGDKFLSYLQELSDCMKISNLPDYFISKRNLFENIPMKYLMVTHKKLYNILDNPIIYLIGALNELRFLKSDYYPVLNYEDLYQILMCKYIEMMPSSYIADKMKLDRKFNVSKDDEAYESEWSSGESDKIKEDLWERLREEDKKKDKKQRLGKFSMKNIDLDVKPVYNLNIVQQILMLELFIDHFIKMAEYSLRFLAIDQGFKYVEHLERLVVLFFEYNIDIDRVTYYFDYIKHIDSNLKKAKRNFETEPPPIPQRNSLM